MKLIFLGATGTVTPARYLLRSGDTSVRTACEMPAHGDEVELV